MKIVLIVLFGIIIYTAIGAFAISAISGDLMNEDPIYIFFSIALWPLVTVALVLEMGIIEPAIIAGKVFRARILKRRKRKN